MKICILVSSTKQLGAAGVRIRYQRIKTPIENIGFSLQVFALDDLREFNLQSFDVLILSKCQDCRSVLLARSAKMMGLIIGLDLFDDYFSQKQDPRFVAQRTWLKGMADNVDFFLCSTQRMFEVAREYLPSKAGYVLSDPCDKIPDESLAKEIETKAFKVRREKAVRVLWFGIASNPSFPVGLRDLIAYSDKLLPFASRGYQVSLTILTNSAGIDAETFDSLRRIAVPFTLLEWSEEREARALSSNFVTFLPVNYQPFSAAKSMNRGISALTGGTQLLTAGHPTYRDLELYAYQDAESLIDDLERDSLKLSQASAPEFIKWMRNLADPAKEASGLAAFLTRLNTGQNVSIAPHRKQAVLHGSATTATLNQFLKKYGALTLATPLIPLGAIKCDAHLSLDETSRRFNLWVSRFGLECLPEALQYMATRAADANSSGLEWVIPINDLNWAAQEQLGASISGDTLTKVATSSFVQHNCRKFFEMIYPQWAIIFSEIDPVYSAADVGGMHIDTKIKHAQKKSRKLEVSDHV